VLTALVGDVDLRVDDGSIRLQWNVARDASVQA